MQFGADRIGEQKILAAYVADIFGGREQRRQHYAIGVHTRGIVLIVEVERMRGGAVGERRARR